MKGQGTFALPQEQTILHELFVQKESNCFASSSLAARARQAIARICGRSKMTAIRPVNAWNKAVKSTENAELLTSILDLLIAVNFSANSTRISTCDEIFA